LNAWTNIYETWYVHHGICAHLNGVLHTFLSSVRVSVCVSLLIVASQRLGEHIPPAKNTCKNWRTVGRVAVWSLSYQRKVCGSVYPPSFLGNGSVNTFPRQRRIVGDVVFYAVRFVSKKSGRLVLPITSWFNV
jgi:hypothetical protein